jgi:hypothetical protein
MVVIPTILSGGKIIHPSYIGPRVRNKWVGSMSPSTRLQWMRYRSPFRIHMVPSIFHLDVDAIIFVARMMRIRMWRLRRLLWMWPGW